jgi:hypothetical protein
VRIAQAVSAGLGPHSMLPIMYGCRPNTKKKRKAFSQPRAMPIFHPPGIIQGGRGRRLTRRRRVRVRVHGTVQFW